MQQEVHVAQHNFLSLDKCVDLTGILTFGMTSFECLRNINLSLLQNVTYPSMTSKSCSLSYFFTLLKVSFFNTFTSKVPGDCITKVKQINSQSDLISMSNFAGLSHLTIRFSVYII